MHTIPSPQQVRVTYSLHGYALKINDALVAVKDGFSFTSGSNNFSTLKHSTCAASQLVESPSLQSNKFAASKKIRLHLSHLT